MNKIYFSCILKNLQSFIDPRNLLQTPKELSLYFRELRFFRKNYAGNYPVKNLPIFYERTPKSNFDSQYVYQAYWATSRIVEQKQLPAYHIDISSSIPFVAQLSSFLPVIQIEYRPPELCISKFMRVSGDILHLPFADSSVPSISCLHVVEHIGLGRYGDQIDPQGAWKALAEVQRILTQNGYLYLSVPVGKPAIYFNAASVFRAYDIVCNLSNVELIEFSFVDDKGHFQEFGKLEDVEKISSALGLFLFRKKGL